jgi:recombination protein RecA
MATALRAELEAITGTSLALLPRSAPDSIPTGIPDVDSIPRGSLTEICGPVSSGRTSVAVSLMAEMTAREEVCALIDTSGAFDPATAAQAGVRLDRLLWIRCGGDAERALKVADLVIQAGGFGLILFDLGDTPLRHARRISLTSWFRLRRAVENTATAIVVIAPEPLAKTCASLVLEMRRGAPDWSGKLMRGMEVVARRSKPLGESRYVRLHSRRG